MIFHAAHHDRTAHAGVSAVGAAWVDSGTVLGIIVVDANRPALIAASRGGLLKQFRTVR